MGLNSSTYIKDFKHLKEGEPFLLEDLFKAYLWNKEPGSLFQSYLATHDSHLTVPNTGTSRQMR
ncbi:MAG: DUF1413 domain-containing protein [Sphaerochaeta sp.]|nr:DUF1413 domain-containing protein [Sphaerochaeta sp.]